MLISEFFENRELFITGGTGFLGKSLIEKLLRDCSGISKIYLLIRSKKDKTPEQRLKEFTNELVFDRLRKEQPNFFEKFIPIIGDSSEIGLGISDEDLKRLRNVSIIIHGAANVRFDNNLSSSLIMNTRGTHELLKIALTLQHLVAFIHTSTAYVNPFLSYVEEKLYDAPVDWRSAIKIAETYDDETLEILKLKYTNYYPNAYTFSKQLSEQVVAEYSSQLPITILRPSIVVPAIREPEPGFADNLNGPMALLYALGVGMSRVTFCDANLNMALIPVDVTTELTIISAYRRGLETLKNNNKYGLDIRNITLGYMYRQTLYQTAQYFLMHVEKNPFQQTVWKPKIFMTTNFWLFITNVFVFNVPMAYIYDKLLTLSGRKPIVMKLTRKLVYTSTVLERFSQQYFKFQNDGIQDLLKHLPQQEKEKFGTFYEIKCLVNYKLMKDVLYGYKKYVLKEPTEVVPAVLQRYKTLNILDRILEIFYYVLAVILLWKICT